AGVDLAYFTAGGVLIVATPVYANNQLLADEAGVGLVMGAFSVSTIVLRPLAGRWSDVRGRRVLIVAGCVGFALVTLGHLLVTELLALVLVRLLLGACEALVFVAGVAALADIVPAGRMGEALSLNSLALYTGMAMGPVLGQLLLEAGGYSAAWLAAAALSGLAAAMAVLLPETRPPLVPDAAPPPTIYRGALRPGLALFCGISTAAGFLAFAALYARELRFEAWSGALFAYGATVIALRVAFRKLPDRLPPAPLAAAALMVMMVALVGLGLVRNPVGLVTGAVVMGAGAAFLTPAIFALVFSTVEPAERGSAAATTSVFIDLALSGGPLLLGLVASRSDLPTAFLALAVVPVLGSLLLLQGRARHQPKPT
ncbi:MAG: MFS transporter, partial [Micropruina sp.]